MFQECYMNFLLFKKKYLHGWLSSFNTILNHFTMSAPCASHINPGTSVVMLSHKRYMITYTHIFIHISCLCSWLKRAACSSVIYLNLMSVVSLCRTTLFMQLWGIKILGRLLVVDILSRGRNVCYLFNSLVSIHLLKYTAFI